LIPTSPSRHPAGRSRARQARPDKPATTESLNDLAPIKSIRTETVLSRLPFHELSKKGDVRIRITRKNELGELELLWDVSPNPRYGAPRQLAYKLDTIAVNRRLDELGRPLPKVIRLGSLRELSKELGRNIPTNDIKKALLQNASAFITAKLAYRGKDGARRRLEAGFTRYSVVFAGEKLPNGRLADAVFLVLNDPYWEVLNNAPIRPLDHEYMKRLPPVGQRFYELLSFQIFAALKNRRSEAKLTYSEYCTFAPQQRYYQLWEVKRQMSPIHRIHLESGYLKDVRYEPRTDAEGTPDWEIFYTAGPKARAEYQAFIRRTRAQQQEAELYLSEQAPESGVAAGPSEAAPPAEQPVESPLLLELTRRGVSATRARKLLSELAPNQQVMDQLEWGDFLIAQNPSGFRNPPGFYISLIRDNVIPPDSFENSRRRQEREERERARQQWLFEEQQLRFEYEHYLTEEKDRYIREHLSQEHYQELLEAKRKRFKRQYPHLPEQTLTEMAHGAIRGEIESQVSFLSFQEWKRQQGHQQG